MASRELRFDVSALDQASKVFVKMAAAVDRFERRLDKLDGKTVDATVDVDTRRAEDKLGRFTTDLRRRMQNAIDAIPPIDLDANSTEADRKLADVRRRMQELRDVRIGVDLSADEAIRRSRELQRELEEISRSDPRVDVRANTDAAARDLAEINREVDRLDGREAVIKVRTDRSLLDSTHHITRLGAAMRAIAIPTAILTGTPALVSLGGSAVVAAGSLGLVPAAANAAGLAVGTLITAFRGFGAAVGSDPEKAAEALAKLTPAARSAAIEVNKLKPAFGDLRRSVQEAFFSGLGERIGDLGGKYMPMLEGATTRVAGQFNVAADQVMQFLGHEKTVATFRAGFLDLGTAIGNLTPTILPFTSILTDIGTVGASVLADITGGAEDAANGLADMVSQARESGAMEAGIRAGLNELRRFGQLAGNTGGILRAMYDAGKASGNDFLGTLINVTGRMDDFLSSAQGQAAMVQIFTGMNSAVTALLPGLEAVGSAIGQIATDRATSGALTSMATAFSDLLVAAAPTAVAISRVVTMGLQPFGAVLGFVAPLLGPVVGGLLAMKAASSALNFLAAATGLKTFGSAALTATQRFAGTTAAATAAGAATATVAAGVGRAASATAGAAATMTTSAAAFARVQGGLERFGSVGARAATAVGKVETAFNKVTSVGGKVVSALPFVGLAFIGVDAAIQATTASLDEAMDAYNQGGVAAEEMRRKVEGQTKSLHSSGYALQDWVNIAGDWIMSTVGGMATVDEYNAAIEEQNRLMYESVSATGISRSSFDQIKNSMDQSKDAAQQVTDSLARVGPALAGVKDGVAPTREMDNALKGVATSAGEAAQQAGLSAGVLGGVAAGATAAAKSMEASRAAFISSATAAGMTEEAAGKLADQLGLIPETARTNFETNAATTAMEIGQVQEKLKGVPPGKTITMNAMTDAAKGQLETLGITVKEMPDGTVQVSADTREAQNNLNSFIAGSRDKKTTITIDGQAQPAQSALNSILGAIAQGRETVTIDGQTQPVMQALSYVLGTVGGAKGDVTIGGQVMSAEQALSHLLAAVNSADGTVKIGAESFTADQILAAFVGRVETPATKPILGDPSDAYAREAEVNRVVGSPATKPMHGDPSQGLTQEQRLAAQVRTPSVKAMLGDPNPGFGSNAALTNAVQAPASKPILGDPSDAYAKEAEVRGRVQLPAIKPMEGNNTGGLSANELLAGAVQTPATKPIEGNPAGGNAANQGLVGAVQTPATKPIQGNNAGGMGQNQGLVGAVQTPATKPINAETGGARGVVSAFVGWVGTLRAVVNIVANKIGFAAGGFMPMATGGVVPMAAGGGPAMPKTWGGNRLNPMTTTAQVVRPRTWRVVGDRAQGDEAYIPLVPSSARSKAILSVAASRMGFDLVPAGSISTAAALRGPAAAGLQLADTRARVQAAVLARSGGPQIVIRAGADAEKLQALVAEFRALRGDLTRGQGWGAVVDRLDALIDIEAKARSSATGRSALARDIGEIGGW